MSLWRPQETHYDHFLKNTNVVKTLFRKRVYNIMSLLRSKPLPFAPMRLWRYPQQGHSDLLSFFFCWWKGAFLSWKVPLFWKVPFCLRQSPFYGKKIMFCPFLSWKEFYFLKFKRALFLKLKIRLFSEKCLLFLEKRPFTGGNSPPPFFAE